MWLVLLLQNALSGQNRAPVVVQNQQLTNCCFDKSPEFSYLQTPGGYRPRRTLSSCKLLIALGSDRLASLRQTQPIGQSVLRGRATRVRALLGARAIGCGLYLQPTQSNDRALGARG